MGGGRGIVCRRQEEIRDQIGAGRMAVEAKVSRVRSSWGAKKRDAGSGKNGGRMSFRDELSALPEGEGLVAARLCRWERDAQWGKKEPAAAGRARGRRGAN